MAYVIALDEESVIMLNSLQPADLGHHPARIVCDVTTDIATFMALYCYIDNQYFYEAFLYCQWSCNTLRFVYVVTPPDYRHCLIHILHISDTTLS